MAATEIVSASLSADAIRDCVNYMGEAVREEHHKRTEGGNTDGSGGLTPVEWALLPALAAYFPEAEQRMIAELLEATRVPTRVVLVHLNIEVPAGDDRSAEKIARAVEGAIEVGSDDERVHDLNIAVVLAEEVQ